MTNHNPILNSPYEEPECHYNTDPEGSLDYETVIQGRRIFTPDNKPVPSRQGPQKSASDVNDHSAEYANELVNLIRREVKDWREQAYPNTTRVTKELLHFWFLNPERHAVRKLFFAQREAIETAIWLNEVATKSNAGSNILSRLKEAQETTSENSDEQLPRIAFKMATGTGKTVVMGTLILYHFFNRQHQGNDTRFADYFLLVAPGITIRDRLGVLFVDTSAKRKGDRSDYYAVRDLVPQHFEGILPQLNHKLVITNYHSFAPKTLQGNKRSPFDGKLGADGKKQEAKEDFAQVVKRLMSNFKRKSRLLILNDEAHHCYKPKAKGRTQDTESDENEKAAMWYTGLINLKKHFTIQQVYDLSATPYYLTGSGYPAYSLFPWVVSDFGLIEAIEAGLVKIPFMPDNDSTQAIDMPVLRNLYDHVKDELPKKGRKRKKSDAKKEGHKYTEEPPKIPSLVKGALDQFYDHYVRYDEGMRGNQEEGKTILSSPPVFIAVCNNTSVSKELYKYIAGYEVKDENGEVENIVPGVKELFSNYDPVTKRPKKKSPTLIIDTDALDNSDQVDADFKKIFASEIDEFKSEYAKMYGQGAADRLTDADLLREVVNTVGEPGKLGGHIRCVISVSMLTEGWDANTVTHIMGLRAFGSQLLCEQVAGRALRRMKYYLKTYRRDTGEEVPAKDRHKFKPENLIEKFPPEYAHIIGVPFRFFKGGESQPVDVPDFTVVKALPERQAEHEIELPNIDGYRIDYLEEKIQFDFTEVENYELDFSNYPLETTMASPFSAEEEEIKVKSVLERRDQELFYLLTKELIRYHFVDEDDNPRFQLFGELKAIVAHWYKHKVHLINATDPVYKRLLFFETPKKVVDHIVRGINTHLNTAAHIRPVFNFYNPFNSTKYVSGNTSKEVFATTKSHVNYVVEDSGWEAKAAKMLEQMPEVLSYVKNSFLGFAIPYVKNGEDKKYFTDFICHVKTRDGDIWHLIIEVSGMSKDKAEKKWYTENRWIPAVNAIRDKHNMPPWAFIEVANDIRDFKEQVQNKIASLKTEAIDQEAEVEG